MYINFDDVDLGIVVNIGTLRDVLAGLICNGRRWWIASDLRMRSKEATSLSAMATRGAVIV